MPKFTASKSSAWWWLQKKDKMRLQALREAGLFGGANAAGAGKAPYFYAQSGLDSQAASRAEIKPKPFVTEAVDKFEGEWEDIMDRVFSG
jgi:hypothetical protein